MVEYTLGYREVIPNQTIPDKWKEIILNTGGSQSTLQDIKVPEKAGGYCYQNSDTYLTRNRFIYWRIIHDVLELVEHSLEVNLVNNRVRYKFTDTPILDGISVHETINSVTILIVTVSSIHKLSFAHPTNIHKQEKVFAPSTDLTLQSIFNEASSQSARDPHSFYVIPTTSSTNPPIGHAAASWLTVPQEDALFALAYNSGIILLLRLDAVTGLVHSNEIKHESLVPRFLSGIATAFRGRTTEVDVAMSLAIHALDNDIYLFALYQEGHLRMWSCNKLQCIAAIDIATNSRSGVHSLQNYGLKKCINSSQELYICTYLKLATGCEFCVLKVAQISGVFQFIRYCTLFAPHQHLVDYSFTMSRLWTAWRVAEFDTIAVVHAQLPFGKLHHNCEWEPAILIQPSDNEYIITESTIDPREAYINYIFQPGQFSLMDISRALNIYRRSNVTVDANLPPSVLKERVCMAVEAEIQSEVMDYELTDEDYLEIVSRCWSKFYSCVSQYHLNGSRPVGLLLLPNVYGAILLKKASFSLLRPMEALEHLMLCNDNSYTTRFKNTPILSQDLDTCNDLIIFMSALVTIENQLPDDVKSTFEKELYQLKSPDIIIQSLLSKFIFDTDESFSAFDFYSQLQHKFENIKSISSVMAMLLEALTYDLGQPNKLKLKRAYSETSGSREINMDYLFESILGISTVSEIITQISLLRFSICRNLIILQQIIMSHPQLFDSQCIHAIKSSLAPRTVVLTQAYFIAKWICESNGTSSSSYTLMANSLQRLSILKLHNTNVGQQMQRSCSLLELFIISGAKQQLHKLVECNNFESSNFIHWHVGMLSYVTLIAQFIWPISGNFFFPEWLLSSSEFLLVQEYVRLLSTWCEWNCASRKFILAISLLEMGETEKACDYFLRASNGVVVDTYLSDLLLPSNVTSENNALVHYYLKVIELFDQHNAYDCIMELAMAAMTVADENDPNLPTLHSIIFAQHLSLQHHIEAYNCLNTNPDAARRVDCLRQLIVTLFDRKKLTDLVSFPYVNMYQDLEKIVEARARSIDVTENNYYDFLHSFHINKGNMRKAASIMYEQFLRLSQEPYMLPIISRQSYCLLACINALNLVNEENRWIVRPVINKNGFDKQYNLNTNTTISGNEILHYKIKKRLEVLELKDIKKEYVLMEAKLKLAKLKPDIHVTAETCPSEVVALMSSAGLYVNALKVCEYFNLCKTSVLENLAAQCVKLNQKDDPNAWNWLNQNDVYGLYFSRYNTTTISWKLLEHLTLKYEKCSDSILHKGITRTLFHNGAFLPQWLYASYAIRNAPEFLRLMLQMGRLEEAAIFSLEYIKSMLGKGYEYFGLASPLIAVAPPVYLPFNIIEMLLLELEHISRKDDSYLELYEQLKTSLNNYLQTVERVSLDMIQMKNQKV